MNDRSNVILNLLLGVLVSTPDARAQPEQAKTCVEAHDRAQDQREAGELMAARTSLARCSDTACPAVVREECVKLVGQLDGAIPSVVVVIVDAAGNELTPERVTIDGAESELALRGRAVEIDPGSHVLAVYVHDAKVAEVSFTLREGEQRRRVLVTARGAAPATQRPDERTAPERPRSSNTLSYLAGGVGIAGLAGFTYFGLTGLSKEKDLERCRPCSDDRLSEVKRSYLLADVSLAVGLVGLGAATYLILSEPRQGRVGGRPLTLDVMLAPRGSSALLSGGF